MYFRRIFLTGGLIILKSGTYTKVSHRSVAKVTIFLDAEEHLVAKDSSVTDYLPGRSFKQITMGTCLLPLQ
jgi:hypothetical protein